MAGGVHLAGAGEMWRWDAGRSGSCSTESGVPITIWNNDATASRAPGTMNTVKNGLPLIPSAQAPYAR